LSFQEWFKTTVAVTLPGDPDPVLRPRQYREPPEALLQEVRKTVSALSGWAWAETREVQGRIRLTHRSWLPIGAQDIHVYVVRGQDGVTRLEAVSQSRSSRGDFGQNRRNLKALLVRLDREVPPLT